MKKKLLVLFFSIAMMGSLSAQGMLTFDLTNFLQACQNGVYAYQQVQSTIKQMQYMYKQAESQVKMVANADINSFRDAVGFVDDRLTYMRGVENQIKNMTIKIGDEDIHISEMYKAPGAFVELQYESLTKEMSDAEKAKVWAYYGLNPANYYYTQTLKERVSKVAQDLTAMSARAEEEYESSVEATKSIAESSKTSESLVAQMQYSNELLHLLSQNIAYMGMQQSRAGEALGSIAYNTSVQPESTLMNEVDSGFFDTLGTYKSNEY